MTVEAIGDPWLPEHVRDTALRRARWVHVAPLVRSDFPRETLAELARGRRVSLDGQGLVRASRLGRLVLDGDYDPGVLRHVSILKLAEEEAAIVLGEAVTRRSLRNLGIPEVIVTLGRRGALVLGDGRLEEVRTRPLEAADPTGAGDAFSTAYLVSRSTGLAPAAAARRAASLVEGLLAGRLR